MRIKELLKEKGITQKEFADKLGMTTVGLSQILNGKPSYTTLEKIASALDVQIWELLVSRDDVVGEQEKGKSSIVCPHCGKEINLIIEK